METRVIKNRLESLLINEYDFEYTKKQLQVIVKELNEEIAIANNNVDSGRVAYVVDELRDTYFRLHEEYDSTPKGPKTLIKRSELISDIIGTITKITNYISWSMAKISSSVDPAHRRLSMALKIELDNFKGQIYSWNDILRTITEDKKLYLTQVKEKLDG